MKKIIILAFTLLFSLNAANAFDKGKVREAVQTQIKLFPDMTLQDLYKSFFQDRFGPEHLITDSAAAAKYIIDELNSSDSLGGPDYETTGYLGNFVRVNLRAVKSGEFTVQELVSALMESAKPTGYSIEKWKNEWNRIDKVIASMNLNLSDYAEMSPKIKSMIDSGKYVMHHSEIFNKYNFHYRIIDKTVFEKHFLKHHKSEIMNSIKEQLENQGLNFETDDK